MTSAPFTSRTGPIWPVDWLRDGRQAWEDGLDAVLGPVAPVVVLGGEQAPDAERMELSTVAAGIVAEAHVCMAYSKGSSKHIAVILLSAW
jgi:hypothetical protein